MVTSNPRAVIWIDADIHRNVKAVAAAKGISLKALAEQAMLEWCLMQPEVRSDKGRTKPLAIRF
jgi:hypothetical protein